VANPSPDKRQRYPVGDLEYGQIVQALKALPTRPRIAEPIDFESITVSTTVLGLDRNKQTVADYAEVTVEDQAVRFRIDGLPASATVGHELVDMDTLTLENTHEMDNFSVIRRDGTDAILRVSYFKYREL